MYVYEIKLNFIKISSTIELEYQSTQEKVSARFGPTKS